MNTDLTFDNLRQMQGKPVYDSQHEKIGGIKDIFLDDATQKPEWIGIGSGGFFGSKKHLVPIEGASVDRDGITVPYTKDQINKTPDIKGDEVSVEQERELYSSYGLTPSQQASPSVMGAGEKPLRGGAETQTGHESGPRSGGEMREGEQSGRTVRIRKYVEAERIEER